VSIKKGSKLLVRQISAIIIVFIILWLVGRVFSAELNRIVIVDTTVMGKPISLNVTQLASLILVLIMAVLIKGMGEPLSLIYQEALKSKAPIASGVTDNILNLVVIAILYMFLRSLVTSLMVVMLEERIANIIYDLIFIIAGLATVYGIIKKLTE